MHIGSDYKDILELQFIFQVFSWRELGSPALVFHRIVESTHAHLSCYASRNTAPLLCMPDTHKGPCALPAWIIHLVSDSVGVSGPPLLWGIRFHTSLFLSQGLFFLSFTNCKSTLFLSVPRDGFQTSTLSFPGLSLKQSRYNLPMFFLSFMLMWIWLGKKIYLSSAVIQTHSFQMSAQL